MCEPTIFTQHRLHLQYLGLSQTYSPSCSPITSRTIFSCFIHPDHNHVFTGLFTSAVCWSLTSLLVPHHLGNSINGPSTATMYFLSSSRTSVLKTYPGCCSTNILLCFQQLFLLYSQQLGIDL